MLYSNSKGKETVERLAWLTKM